jgi:hypothetical protein
MYSVKDNMKIVEFALDSLDYIISRERQGYISKNMLQLRAGR